MSTEHDQDLLFTGSIPELYEQYLVPLIFQPYADDLAGRLVAIGATTVLEIAAGTGVLTRALASRLHETVAITATDLNPPMLDHAASRGTSRPVTWQAADALALPFDDDSFDAVVCQFGVMFFPDRPRALAEMRRVLRPGGTVVFNVWDRLDRNQLAHVVTDALAAVFPDDPPHFLARIPHGYHEVADIRADLASAGFVATPRIDTIEARSRAASATDPAIGYCQGTPLRNEIEARDPDRLTEATAVAAAAISERFGPTDIDTLICAHVITVHEP